MNPLIFFKLKTAILKQCKVKVLIKLIITMRCLVVCLILGLYDAIVLDVDSKDISAGVSSPPLAFVEKHFLTNSKLLLKDSGIWLMTAS